MRLHARTYLMLACSILASWAATLQAADPERPVEYRVKAAYLYNFTRFIEWPEDAKTENGKEIEICLLGKDDFGAALKTIAGKNVRGSKIVIRRNISASKANGCHVVFFSESVGTRTAKILKQLRKQPVLTIGEAADFNALGGIIQFTLVKNKIRFNIDPDAAKRARLSVSSKLLNLATIVRQSR